MRIVVFGDSIAYGAWGPKGGWVEYLKADAHAKTVSGASGKNQVFNLGVGGHATQDILERFERETQTRSSEKWPLFLVFQVGVNDSRSQSGDAQSVTQTPETQYVDNLGEIIERALQITNNLLFVLPLPIRGDQEELTGRVYSNEAIKRFYFLQKEILQDRNVSYIDLYDEFVARKNELYHTDNIHLNDAGHQCIFEAVKEKLTGIIAK